VYIIVRFDHRERLYFDRIARSRTPTVVLGTTSIKMKLMYLSVKGVLFGNDFIFLLHLVSVHSSIDSADKLSTKLSTVYPHKDTK